MEMRRVIVAMVCLIFFLASSAPAANEWWRLGTDGKTKASETTTKQKSASGWWPWSSTSSKKSTQPSVYQKFTRGTKNAWNKTVDFINPFDNKPADKPKSTSEPNSSGWFTPRRTEERPVSVSDWIAGERPSY